jgi:hypothetical protein
VKHWLPTCDKAETHPRIFLSDTLIAMKKQSELHKSSTEAHCSIRNDQTVGPCMITVELAERKFRTRKTSNNTFVGGSRDWHMPKGNSAKFIGADSVRPTAVVR